MKFKEGLNTLQLQEALKTHPVTKTAFAGVYAVDQVQHCDVHPPCLVMVNSDPQWSPGEHWLLFYFVSDTLVEMFDSLGKDLSHYAPSLTHWIGQQVQEMDRMTERVQPLDSALCGHYCLFYAYCRGNGETMRDITQHMPSPHWIENCIPVLFDIQPINSTQCQHCIRH